MSYFPNSGLATSVEGFKKFSTFQGVLDVTRTSPFAKVTVPFTVPALYGTVQLTMDGTSGFLAGDTVAIGEHYGYYSTALHPSLPNTLNCTIKRLGSWRSFYTMGLSGIYVIASPASYTTSTGPFMVPDRLTRGVGTIEVASTALAGNDVNITTYAGVYKVVSVDSATLMTVRLAYRGHLLTGMICPIQAYVSQGVLLGFTSNVGLGQFFPTNIITQVKAVTSGGSSNTPAISVGWAANYDSGAAREVFGNFIGGSTSGGGTISQATGAVVNRYKFHNLYQNQNADRLAAPPGMPIFAATTTRSTATDYDIIVCVRGFYSEA